MDDQILTIKKQMHIIESKGAQIPLDQCGEYFRPVGLLG